MNVSDLKSDLHRLIVEVNDINMLMKMKEQFYSMTSKDALVEAERKFILSRLENFDPDKTRDWEEVMKNNKKA